MTNERMVFKKFRTNNKHHNHLSDESYFFLIVNHANMYLQLSNRQPLRCFKQDLMAYRKWDCKGWSLIDTSTLWYILADKFVTRISLYVYSIHWLRSAIIDIWWLNFLISFNSLTVMIVIIEQIMMTKNVIRFYFNHVYVM